jgi:hypothetical protein
MIKPTIGRVVWFWPATNAMMGGELFTYHDRSQPCAALVAFVWSDAMVNLSVADQNGVQHAFTSVPLIQEGDERPSSYFCEWMPYQKGQAAKAEALEKAAQ